ncbi:MAG: GNAT family N-acetyltransferase [candidate division KSB1 bacterium]|nr:GNAT family N-acetyltransferase [candidate division KSB1 bacterium]
MKLGVNIRPLLRQDLEPISHLIAEAFTYGRQEDGYAEVQVPPCRVEMLDMYLSTSPPGCMVAERGGRLVGVAFSHVYGSTGWVGPVAVAPQAQGRGVGTELMRRTVEFLRGAGCTTIGLETMPRSYRNLGFYLKLGFLPQQLTCELVRPVGEDTSPPASEAYHVRMFSQEAGQGVWSFLGRAAELANVVAEGTDYAPLIRQTAAFRFGETLLWEQDGQNLALAVVHTEPYFVGQKRNLARLVVAAIPEQWREKLFPAMLAQLEEYASREVLDLLCLRVPANSHWALRYALTHGFKIIHSDLRMTLEGYPERVRGGAVHLNRWE